MYDLREFIKNVKKIIEAHNLGETGAYRRWLSQNESSSRDMGLNVYASSNAANILYSIGDLTCDAKERAAFIEVLQSFQDKDTGLFHQEGNFEIHTTAFCIGALELLDAKPKYPLYDLKQYAEKDGLIELMESLDWTNNPWLHSHKGAGIYGAMVLSENVTLEWQEWYFQWLKNNVDTDTGLWRKNCIYDEEGKEKGAPIFHHLASSFHYVFNHEYAKRPIPYPEKIVDTCIKMYREKACPIFGEKLSFSEIDFIYALSRCQRRAGTRLDECQAIIKEIADKFVKYVLSLDPETHDGLNDLNLLFATICALAAIQEYLPGFLITEKPLRLVLDRRPFL